jgi:hypothetical protein
VISDATAFIDLSTLRLAFQINNTSPALDGAPLRATGDPGSCWFQRARVYVAGTLVEDIYFYNRVSSMMRLCKSPQRLWAESIELLGQTTDGVGTPFPTGSRPICGGPSNADIPAASSQTIVTPLHTGLTNSHYFLSGRFPVTIELELVSRPEQCCRGRTRLRRTQATPPRPTRPGLFSQQFTITNARLLCDMITCDVAIQNAFSESLARGQPLQLAISSYSTTMHNVLTDQGGTANLSWDISLSRAYSRIKDVWVTFDSDAAHGVQNTESNTFLNWHGKPQCQCVRRLGSVQSALGRGLPVPDVLRRAGLPGLSDHQLEGSVLPALKMHWDAREHRGRLHPSWRMAWTVLHLRLGHGKDAHLARRGICAISRGYTTSSMPETPSDSSCPERQRPQRRVSPAALFHHAAP